MIGNFADLSSSHKQLQQSKDHVRLLWLWHALLQFNWRPRANGNKKMIKILDALEDYSEQIEAENHKVTDKIKNAQPFLVDVVPKTSLIQSKRSTTSCE